VVLEKAQTPTTAKPDYSKEAFVIEQLRRRYRFENDGTGRKVGSFRIHVLSEAGVQAFGQLRFGYNSANDQMEIGYVRVTKPDGTVVRAGPDAVQDLTGSVQQVAPVYTDYREKHITAPAFVPATRSNVKSRPYSTPPSPPASSGCKRTSIGRILSSMSRLKSIYLPAGPSS
jgi:hypothetical protein